METELFHHLLYLPPRKQKILALRLGLEGNRKHTLAEVGTVFGVSGERIRQVEKEAMRRLLLLGEKSHKVAR